MKVYCGTCFDYVTLEIQPFTPVGDEVRGEIVCPICNTILCEFQCDDDEFENDPNPEGYYDLSRVPDYYPNGG